MFDGFHSAIVGVDGSDASIVALDQARRLLAEGGALTAVTVCEERLAVHAGFNAPAVAEGIHVAAAAAQARAAKELASLPGAEARLAHGKPAQRLLAAGKERRADLLAVGCHEHSRAGAIVFGSVPSELLHYASETVLVARRRERPEVVSIVVGVDGSPASLAALAVAREVAARGGHIFWPSPPNEARASILLYSTRWMTSNGTTATRSPCSSPQPRAPIWWWWAAGGSTGSRLSATSASESLIMLPARSSSSAVPPSFAP